jgi:GntR family transcriptional regulator
MTPIVKKIMSKTRYAQVAQDLIEGITTGRYPVGSLLPTEMELCKQYGSCRHTVRTAIRELQDLGLVSRRKKVGTRVETATPFAGGYRQSLSSINDLMQYGAKHLRIVRKVEPIVADRALSKKLDCLHGKQWLRLSCLRLTGEPGGLPIGWADNYVDPAYAELIDIIQESPETLISSLIEKKYGRRIAEIRQDIQAVQIPSKLSKELQSTPGSPALKVVRRYFDQGGMVFLISITIHPAERFTFSIRLTREMDITIE